ncbi:ATP-dependent 6-phosphofructokinase [Christensenellaceae bacterium]|nr:ATP-dependent 6-phosphofructokinase [Christensenellaceae bacterium]BDF61279.1 ATP-dependent 6-phosphofructokinase [Christensenellaceae bacterium]
MRKKIGVLTSGGDTPAMNAAIKAVVMAADSHGMSVMGIEKGYAGLIDGRAVRLKPEDIDGIEGLGGTILKTARCPAFLTAEGQQQALKTLRAFGITELAVIGGDGSFAGAQALTDLGVPAVGIPGTIDNDLAYTDYTIGFDTAVNCVVDEMSKIRDTMLSHERVGVIEVMGNKCGDIALFAGIAGGAEHIVIPEYESRLEDILEKVLRDRIRGKMTSLILVAEGAGKGADIARYLSMQGGVDAKAIVLGYIQRGGAPTMRDRLLATRLGIHAAELLFRGIGGRVTGVRNDTVIDEDIHEALQKEKILRAELMREFMMVSGNRTAIGD